MWQNESVELTINKKKTFSWVIFIDFDPSSSSPRGDAAIDKIALNGTCDCAALLIYISLLSRLWNIDDQGRNLYCTHVNWTQWMKCAVHIALCAQCNWEMQFTTLSHPSASSEVCIRSTSCDDHTGVHLYIVYCALYIGSLWPFPRAAIFSLLGNK